MSGSFSSADASAPPPFDASIYDDLWAPLNQLPDFATYLQSFDAPPASTGGTDLYAYDSQAQVAADPRQDLYLLSVNTHGQPAAATLRDGEACYPGGYLPSSGANAAVPSTSVRSTPELIASADVTSRSVTPASTSSSPWDSYDALPVAGPGAFPISAIAKPTNELSSADAPIFRNPGISALAAEPEAPATVVDAPVARRRHRLARKRKPADYSRWDVSGPEEQQQRNSENLETFKDKQFIWDLKAPELSTVKIAELAQVLKTQRRAGKSTSARRADSGARGRRSESCSSSSSHPEPPTTPTSPAQTPAPPRGRRISRGPPPPAPATAQDASGPEFPGAPLYRPRASSSAPTRAPAPYATSRAPARSQSSAPALVHAQVLQPFEEVTIPAAENHAEGSTASELRMPSALTGSLYGPLDLDHALAVTQAMNDYGHENFAATEHLLQHDQLPVAGSALGLHFDPAHGALPSSGPVHRPVSPQRYAPPGYPPPGWSSSSTGTIPARTHGPQPGQPSYRNTPLPPTTASYDPRTSCTPHTPHESYYATSNEDAPVRNRKRRMPDDGFLEYGARTFDYNAYR